MKMVNAFIGHSGEPTGAELSATLGPASSLWSQLVQWLTRHYGVDLQEWKSYSSKAGWSLRVIRNNRTILYLLPFSGCFGVGFVLSDKAIQSARQHKVPASLLRTIEASPRYAEGTGVRLVVKSARDLAAVRKLTELKLAC